MRYFLLLFAFAVATVMVVAGKRGDLSRRPPIYLFPDMKIQPKLRPQTANEFYGDGLSSQLPVPGTVARGSAYEESPVNTGRLPGTTNFVADLPVPVTEVLLARGQERFNISCAVCHGALGDGKGTPAKLGMTVIGDLHDAKARKVPQQPDGEIFNTISNGKGLMGGYAGLISIADRWAIVAYVRALQRSRLASLEDVPAEMRPVLMKQ